jgi:hypothetical protein
LPVAGDRPEVTKADRSRRVLERTARDGDSPVGVGKLFRGAFPSSAGHEKPGANLPRPRGKAKYSLATDSAKVA